MTGTATVTGKIGPGFTLTTVVILGITEFSFDIVNSLFKYSIGTQVNQIDISAATTITVVLDAAAGNYTITIS